MIRIVIPGPPPRKNARGTIAMTRRGPRRVTPKKTRKWRDRLYQELTSIETIRAGRWSVEIDVYEDSLRHLDVDVPHGDIDSSIAAILDALQPKKRRGHPPLPGLLDDDARVVELYVAKHYSASEPRVEVMLKRTL